MAGVNKVILVGNLGADPETRATGGGTSVTNVRLATSENWTDRNSGERQERTEWHRITFFGRQAEVASQYLRKGSKVYIEGRIQTDKWQDQNGQDRYTTQIIAREMQMLDRRGDNAGGSGGGGSFDQSAPPPSAPQSSGQPAPREDFDDDIPF